MVCSDATKCNMCFGDKAKKTYLCTSFRALDEHRNPHLDVSIVAAGWSGGSHIVVFPKQKAILRQSVECHFVCSTDTDGWLGGFAAFQSADKAEI